MTSYLWSPCLFWSAFGMCLCKCLIVWLPHFWSTGYNHKYEYHYKYSKLRVCRNDVLFPWSSPCWRSRKRSAENDSCVFQVWHWAFTHLRLWAFKHVYISRGNLQKPVYFSKETHMKQIFYFPIKIMVPISMIFWGRLKMLLDDAFNVQYACQVVLLSSVEMHNFFSITH